ncbi:MULTISPECIES: glycosyltransferase [Halorubrum]|uniref:Glycosyl transferase family protein n=1 Tax=Halorubrum hochstenium ATCC 700873 TaxID=1227481 RepID=M0FEW9_9EURY|nr:MULTISPECIES: glycosyltransferase family 2 protein [Halorubrum]ELZ58551.1 glycosyl transferase family protein [Halorubrum hochstenium ATCC 700873]
MPNDPAAPVSVVLPTREWTPACAELAAQVGPADEFLVACDGPSDPVVDAAEGTAATVVVAGEPTGCSAKCNALAAGLERASRDRLVCTDADFEHGEEWLATVRRLLARVPEGHVLSTAPVLASEGPVGKLLEPSSAVGVATSVRFDSGVWGGTMAFRRGEVDVDAYVADLRRTAGDDALLAERADGIETARSLVREMPVDGTLCGTLSRRVRWTRMGLYLDPAGIATRALLPLAVIAGTLAAPFVTVPLVTGVAAAAYAALGVHRWTFLLAVPGYALALLLLCYGLARDEFEWTGRRYRWESLYDVTVLDPDGK